MARETTEVRAAASAGLRTVARDGDCEAEIFLVPTSLAVCCEFDRRFMEAVALSLALAGTLLRLRQSKRKASLGGV